MGYGRRKWHSFFQQLAAILNVPFRPNWLLNLSYPSSKGSNVVDFGTILSYARKIRKGLRRLALCQGQRSCRVKKWEKSRVEVFIYDFPKLHHSSPNSFGANGHLHKKVCKTGKVIERSRDVTPRPKREKSKGPPRSPCALNMVQFRPLFPELRHFEKNGTRHFF